MLKRIHHKKPRENSDDKIEEFYCGDTDTFGTTGVYWNGVANYGATGIR